MQCSHCDQEHPEGTKFCPITGDKIIMLNVCPQCGKPIDPNWLYCNHCGRELIQADKNPNPQEAQAVDSDQVPTAKPGLSTNRTGSRRVRWLIITGAVGALLIVAAVMCITLWKGINYLADITPAKAPKTATPNTPTIAITPVPTLTPAVIPTTVTGSGNIGEMVLVPAGTFQMGCDPNHDGGKDCYDNDYNGLRLHTVYLDAYQIDIYEVTNASYEKCVATGWCTVPNDFSSSTHSSYYENPAFANYPVIHVDWDQASAYCAWVDKRLPTEAEWEKAARGSNDTRPFPWGDATPSCELANTNLQRFGGSEGCVGDTTAVGSYPSGASPYGALDMVGNVWEWVADWWQDEYYLYSSINNPLGPITGDYKAYRGGDWNSYLLGVSEGTGSDFKYSPEKYTIGFRCAASPADDTAVAPAGTPIAVATPALGAAPPQPGKANVIGRVVWKDQPVTGVEVKICESINSFSGCAGAQSTATTDAQGNFAIADATPGDYVIMVHAIDKDGWFTFKLVTDRKKSMSDVISRGGATPFNLAAGQTLIIGDLLIYKFDLKQTFPANEEEISQGKPTLTWDAYPGAAYYGIYFGQRKYPAPAGGEKIIGNSFTLARPLPNCDYDWKVEAFDLEGYKISEFPYSERFQVIGQTSSCDLSLNSPEDEAELRQGDAIELSWQPDSAAVYYELTVYDTKNGYSADQARIVGSTYILAGGLPSGEYSWTVSAYDNDRLLASVSDDFTITGSSQTLVAPTSIPTINGEIPMALIPAGSFQMGSERTDDEKPIHTVTLNAFKMDVYEVTNARYAECVAAGPCQPPEMDTFGTRKDYYGRTQYPNHPVINVSWYDAQAYCEWRGARLPSEAEWEKAARGGLAGKLYSWGDDFPVCTPGAPNGAQSEYCPSQSDMAQTMAVGNFVPNGYGLFDMIGNAAEWVNDWYESDYYSRSPDSNPMGPGTNPTGYMIPKVVRGGAYESSSSYLAATLRVATRGQYIPEYGSLSIGFRCAASP